MRRAPTDAFPFEHLAQAETAGAIQTVIRRGPTRLGSVAALAVALLLGNAPLTLADKNAPDATPPSANEAPSDEAVTRITESEWRSLVSGKTLYYSTPSGFMGREYYPPNSDRSIFIYFDGACFDGTWSEDDGLFCFQYDGEHCFEHLRQGERLFVRELDGDTQDVVRITDEVLSCEPALLSAIPPRSVLR